MPESPSPEAAAIAANITAPQHGPRPLPLFLDILWKQTEGDQLLRSKAFAGLRRYQEAERPLPAAAYRIAASVGPARLLHYGTENSGLTGAPVLCIPSLINPPNVLDIAPDRSLLRYLAAQNLDPWLVDWGSPGPEDTALDLAGHVTERLLPLIESLPQKPLLVGYCLGGTLALAAAALGRAQAVTTIAAPWRFSGLPSEDRSFIDGLWTQAQPMCRTLGYVPMEVLQSGFWALDPARTIRKYAAFADMEPESQAEQAFMALEDWANAGPPLTYAAGAELFEKLYRDDITGRGAWRIADTAILPSALPCPGLSVRSSSDRIVPAALSPTLDENLTLALGHVGMIVGGRARESLWAPLVEWLSRHGAR